MSVAKIEFYLADISFACDLRELPDDAYLVGGSVRDAILQRTKIPLDLDFVLPQKAIATAKKLANLYHAGFVVLDEDRGIARVVFQEGTLDLALQVGTSLETDLKRRDFTINAIAYNIKSQHLVDPFGGLADLEHRTLRMVAVENLEDDPLRLLRAYRQAAQLNFTIEPQTKKAICERTGQLARVAAERVRAELDYLFTAPQGNKWLATAIEDGVLNRWLPHGDRVSEQDLQQITKGIEFCQKSGLVMTELTVLSKLSALVAADVEVVTAELVNLKYARNQIKAIVKTVKYLPQLQQMTRQMTLREQYFWFLEVKDIVPIIIARAIATGVSRQLLDPLIQRYLDPHDPVAYPQCLVTGNDLMRELDLKPSRVIGELLTEIQIAQIESEIANYQEAIKFAQHYLRSLI
ncbi:MAG: CCA tRNA nucleotidyltransferase [Cyanobacteria bacterium J06623_7]